MAGSISKGSFSAGKTFPEAPTATQMQISITTVRRLLDCQNIARRLLAERNDSAVNYRAVVLLFNFDKRFANQTGQFNDHEGTYVRLRYSGGTGGGWTSEALWAHELGHAFGLVHTTYPTRADGNQYNDFQDAMSGFAQSVRERWDFPAGGVCSGISGHPRCIYDGEGDQIPVL